MNWALIPILLAGFLIVLFSTPVWIRKAKQIGLIWKDMNKYNSKTDVAGSGGIVVVSAWVICALFIVAYNVFYLNSTNYVVEIFSIITLILMVAGIGLIDDLLGWQRGGLSRRSRLFLVALCSIPLVVINAGKHTMLFPFLGTIDLGLFYPLLLVPLGVIATTTTFNFLAGFNGLEAGQGIIILSALSLVSYLTGNSMLALILLSMVVCLLAFLLYNFYPARIFPGDSLTYSIGALIAVSAILGNFEKIAVFLFIPYILEVLLKGRGKYLKQSFGLPKSDGSLDLKYDKIYGLEHLAIYLMQKFNITPTEKRVVYSIWAFQLIIILIGFIIFREGIFIR